MIMPHTCFWSYLHSWIDIFKFSRPLYNCPALHLSWQCIAVILTSYDARICFWSNLHSWINIFKFSRGLYNCPALHSFWYCVAVMLASLYVSPLWSEWVNEEFICTMGALCIGNTFLGILQWKYLASLWWCARSYLHCSRSDQWPQIE